MPVLYRIFIFVLTGKMHKSNTVNVVNALFMNSMTFLKHAAINLWLLISVRKKCLITAVYFPAINLNCALPWKLFYYCYDSWLETKPEEW